MGPTSSAPPGGAGGPPVRPPAPTPGPLRPPPGPGYYPPRPARPPLTGAQQTQLYLVSAVAVVLGVAFGLLATLVLPHVYAAQATIRYSVANADSDSAERDLTTQTVLITGREVLQPVANTSGVPVDYLANNVTATVVPSSEIIQIQARHPDRNTGIQLADAVAKRYVDLADATGPRAATQAQLNDVQRQLANPQTPVASVPDLRLRVTTLQTQLDTLATSASLATIVAPAYSLEAAVFPNTLVTIGVGALVGIITASLIGSSMVRRWRRP